MLKANVGLSRKVSRDYQSTGYSVNLEGEIMAALDDHEGVLGRIKELFSLAEEALAVEIDRDQGEQAIGRRDEETKSSNKNATAKPNGSGEPNQPSQNRGNGTGNQNGNGNSEDAITSKQTQFIFNLAKRQRLSTGQLEAQIEQLLGRRARVYDLSKREAGRLIDALTQDDKNTKSANSRS